MKANRRQFLSSALAAGSLLPLRGVTCGAETPDDSDLARRLDEASAQPVLRREGFSEPVRIASVEVLRAEEQYIVRVVSSDGAVGHAVSTRQRMQYLCPMLLQRVAPYFLGKDARDLDALVDGVYLHEGNYKLQGLAFWVCVASVEMAVLDMLGRTAGVSIVRLVGEPLRKRVGVYYANNYRGKTAEESVRRMQENVARYPVGAIKFKIGGRMSRNADDPAGRTEALIPLVREAFGDRMVIYADSNGSYDSVEAIRIGSILEEHGVAFYEEPCPFDHLEETRRVADALEIPIAGGEQESSMRRFRWMILNNAVQVVQPDLFYFGGFVRSIRVARMAAEAGMQVTPHMAGVSLGYLYVLHFASCVQNVGPHMEFKGKNDAVPFRCPTSTLELNDDGTLTAPTGPGLGIEIDEDYLSRAEVLRG